MNRHFAHAALAIAVFGSASLTHAVSMTVDPAAQWLGYMNVFNLDSAGGAFQFGSPWGLGDLPATFDGATLTLAPNSIGDPNEYWYTPSGGPGSTGNKKMDAVFYVENSDTFVGQTVNFTGTVLSNSLTSAHQTYAFIRDFAPNYSSFVETHVLATPGAFDLTLVTVPEAGRHVQYGFETLGACVWITDVAPYGQVKVTASTPHLLGDFDIDGDRDAHDIDLLFSATPGAIPPANAIYDVNADGQVKNTVNTAGSDADYWVRTIKATEYGDSNLDGKVDFDDLLTLAQNYNTNGTPSWAAGNFNGDVGVNFDDLLTLAQHYRFGVLLDNSALADAGGSTFVSDLALARSMVPEPTSLALGTLAFAMGRRRRS